MNETEAYVQYKHWKEWADKKGKPLDEASFREYAKNVMGLGANPYLANLDEKRIQMYLNGFNTNKDYIQSRLGATEAYNANNIKQDYNPEGNSKYLYDYLKSSGYDEATAQWISQNKADAVRTGTSTSSRNGTWTKVGDGGQPYGLWVADMQGLLNDYKAYKDDQYKQYSESNNTGPKVDAPLVAPKEPTTEATNPADATEENAPERPDVSGHLNKGVGNTNGADYTGLQTVADTQQAIAEGAQAAQTAAEKSAAASASAGINRSRAGMLSDAGTQTMQTNNIANIATANAGQRASTQADYLAKMSQADALDQQAKNMNKGAGLTALGAGIQGAASGAALGTVISDENCKEAPDDFDKRLADAIKQFRTLYRRVRG